MNRAARTQLRAQVALAADAIAPAWPLDTFVAVNPLLGFESQPFGDATARAAELFRAVTLPGSGPGPRETFDPLQRARDLIAAIGVRDTLGDWCVALGWNDVPAAVDERLGRWLAAYLDRGDARVAMPGRERGFFAAWKRLARAENALAPHGRAYRRAIDALPERADDALLEHLERLAIPLERRGGYLQRHLAQCAGWAAYVKRLADEESACGIDLVALLAVRLWYERCYLSAAVAPHRIAPTFTALRDALLAEPSMCPPAAPVLERDAHANALAALERRERRFADDLLATLAQGSRREPVPDAQLVFCIDARSEVLRRALEAAGPYATFGFAGFYGVPLRYRPFGSPRSIAQAPVLVRPRTVVDERPDAATAARLRRRDERDEQRRSFAAGALGEPAASFAGVEWFGPFAALNAFRRTFAARRDAAPPAALPLDLHGFSSEERVFFAEASLRIMGLTTGFAPLVVFCGHGASTVNNAFAAALDCGACGGNRGLVNARVLAAFLNDGDVRTALAERGIDIPPQTWFAAAEHDTTADVVTLTGDVPATQRERVARLRASLERAGAQARIERLAQLPAAPVGANDPFARSGDWAQPRPEWGLARNAAIVIGPRRASAAADLGGRCFLHSYEAAADGDGAILEQILTAPLIVASWINLQYFFASVDPLRFGSGDKLLQQPVGGIGVVLGNGGDLRLGLPWQSTRLGDATFHEPLRLLAVVYAPPARIDAIVARQQVLQRLFDHRWVSLIAIDPADGRPCRYEGNGRWANVSPTEIATCAPTR